MLPSRMCERIEGFHTKLDSASEEVVKKCRKCKTKLFSQEVNYASKGGASIV